MSPSDRLQWATPSALYQDETITAGRREQMLEGVPAGQLKSQRIYLRIEKFRPFRQ